MTPGRGPNGPGPIDMRQQIASVKIGSSSVPYGAFGSFAAFNSGVWGYIGPSADALRKPTAWYVRATGSNNNGGSSSGTAAERTGTDGSTTNGSLTFTSATGAFTPDDIGKGICIQNATFCYAKITAINSATSVQLSNPPSATAGSLSWSIGGAWADPRPFLNCTAFANTTCGVQSGDTVYVGAGTYRQVYALGANWGALWNASGGTTKKTFDSFNGRAAVVGDVTGQFTGDAGMVQLTAYTTNDKTAPSATTLLNLSGKSNLAFTNIQFTGGNAIAVTSTTTNSQNIVFRDCGMIGYTATARALVNYTGLANQAANWLIDRCHLWGVTNTNAVVVTIPMSSLADYDINFVVTNCVCVGSSSNFVIQSGTGALTFSGGGIKTVGVAFYGVGTYLITTAAKSSLVFPCTVTGSMLCAAAGAALSAGTSGHIVESYNLIYAATPRTNVAVGTGSVSDGSYANLFHFGQERIWADPNGVPLFKPFGEPMQSSPLLGFGSRDPIATNPLDLLGLPRPAGYGAALSQLPAVGALERHNNWTADPAPIGDGSTPIKFTGPGDQAFIVPVPARPITVTVKVAWDAAYQGVKPQLQLQANGSIGVEAQTATAVGSGTVETLTVGPFTPTAAGKQVVIRLRSNDLTGTSVVQADQFTVTG